MVSFFSWFRLFGTTRLDQLASVQETGNPKPAKDAPAGIEPIGFGNELFPMDPGDRKNPAAVVSASLRAAQEGSRIARYADFDAMDSSDFAVMLDGVVDAVLTFEDVSTGRGFKVESDKPKIQALLDRAKKMADLEQVAEEILRDFLKYGDGFVEPLFSKTDLVGCQTYKPAEMFVVKDDKNIPGAGTADITAGYPIAFYQKKFGAIKAGWNAWEIVHFKFWPSRKLLYSEKGLLDALRADWRKLQLVEQGMVVARVTRAYPRRVHYVDVTNKNREDQENILKEYIRRMTRRQFGKKPVNNDNLPTVDVSDDLYVTTGYTTGADGTSIPMLNKTEIEDPAMAGLSELADVEYLRQKSWSQVPSDIVGVKRNTSGDLDTQDIAFTRLLRRCQRQLEKGLRGIFDQVLLANGILPSTVTYRITFPAIDVRASWKYSDARFKASMTIRNVLEMGMGSRRWAMRQMYNYSDPEVTAIWDEMKDEMNNPVFQAMLAPARNGQPGVDPTQTGQSNKAGNDTTPAPPSASKVIPATGANPAGAATTKTGIDRGTKLGQGLRGNMSGG